MIEQSWVRTGGVCGVLAMAFYLSLIVLPLPDALGRLLFFAFPMLIVMSVVGLYRLLRAGGDSVALQAGALLAGFGAAICTVMAIVQQSAFYYVNGRQPTVSDPDLAETVKWVVGSVHSVQLGLDVAWDVFALVGFLLLAWAMLRHPRFGPVFGVSGLLVAASVLVLNLVTFPVPPDPDLGPLMALWMLAVYVRMLGSSVWVPPADALAPAS